MSSSFRTHIAISRECRAECHDVRLPGYCLILAKSMQASPALLSVNESTGFRDSQHLFDAQPIKLELSG